MSKYLRIETNDGRILNFSLDQTDEEWISGFQNNQANLDLIHKAPLITKFLAKLK